MGPRVWAGLALVLLALMGLAAVLPQGETDFDQLRPDKFRPPKSLPYTPTSIPPLPEDFDLGSFVKDNDLDTQFDLEDLPDFQQFNSLAFQDLNGNGRYDNGEPLYLQNQPGSLQAGDLSLGDGQQLREGDGRIGQPTLPLEDAQYAYHDRDGDGAYTPGEPLYLDVDGSGSVTAGDVRMSDADAQYDPQTQVQPGDGDVGRDLNTNAMPDVGDEKYYDRNGNGRLDEGDGLYLDMDDSGNPSEGDLRMGQVPAGDPGPSGGLSDEEKAALAAAALAAGLAGQDSIDPDDYRAGPTDPGSTDYASDRNGAAGDVTCINFYSYGSTCHNRGAAFSAIQRTEGGEYLFLLDDGPYQDLAPGSAPAGTVSSTGEIPLQMAADRLTPVTSLTPDQVLVSFSVTDVQGTSGTPQLTLVRDDNDMVWARSDRSARLTLRITWAVDPDYFDLYVPAGLKVQDIPAAQRPVASADVQAVGREIAAAAGTNADEDLDQIVSKLAAYFSSFGEGPIPGKDQYPDDMLAITYGKNGCCRHRAEAFTVAAQSLGVPTRLVINEAHAFAEVWIPGNGWRMVDLGGCGDYEVQDRQSHDEAPTDPDLPVHDNLDDDPAPPPTDPPIPTSIEITSTPSRLRRNVPFEIGGTVTSAAGNLPAGIPITFYYNETKDAPGTQFCTGATDGDASFQSTCTMPSDAPVGDFQLVARLASGTLNGRPTAVAYSDPPFSVESPTSLSVQGPTRTVLGSDQAYTATLHDEFGQPVADGLVQFSRDGAIVGSGTTDALGRASVRVPLATTGAHTIQARFAGDDHYGASVHSLNINTLDMTVEADVVQADLANDTLHVTGSVRDAFGVLGGEALTLTFAAKATQGATDGQGRIDLRITTPIAPGNHTATLRLEGFDASLQIAFTKTLQGTLEATLPTRWSHHQPLRLQVHAGFPEETPGLQVEVRLDGTRVGLVDLDASANATWTGAQAPAVGRHRLEVRLAPLTGYGAPSLAGDLEVGNVSLAYDAREDVVAAGATLHARGRLTFNGAPLDDEPVRLGLASAAATTTTHDGDWSVDLVIPGNLPLGSSSLRLQAPNVGYDEQRSLPIGRPTQIEATMPRLAWKMGGSISFTARATANGTSVNVPLDVRAGDESLQGASGSYSFPAFTWLARTVPVEVSHPGQGEYAAASSTTRVVVVNPLTTGGLLLLLAGAVGTTLVITRRRTRTAARLQTAPPLAPTILPQGGVQIIKPALPIGVPPVFDPKHDKELIVQAPDEFAGAEPAWQSGHPAHARLEGSKAILPIHEHPPGADTLLFARDQKTAGLDLRVQPFFEAVEGTFRGVAATAFQRALRPNEAVRLTVFERALCLHWKVSEEAARRVRTAYEIAMYAREDCTRDQFEAFFISLEQLRPQQPAGGTEA